MDRAAGERWLKALPARSMSSLASPKTEIPSYQPTRNSPERLLALCNASATMSCQVPLPRRISPTEYSGIALNKYVRVSVEAKIHRIKEPHALGLPLPLVDTLNCNWALGFNNPRYQVQ